VSCKASLAALRLYGFCDIVMMMYYRRINMMMMMNIDGSLPSINKCSIDIISSVVIC